MRQIWLAVPIGLMLFGSSLAEDYVIVESKTVIAGTPQVTIGVYLRNEADLSAVVIPFEIRSLENNAFLADHFSLTIRHRLMGLYDRGFKIFRYMAFKRSAYGLPTTCDPDSLGEFWVPEDGDTGAGSDFNSPDALMYVTIAWDNETMLAAGTDGVPSQGNPSMLLSFGANGQPGQFEIDTTCIIWGNHLTYCDWPYCLTEVHPSFTKGIVTVEPCFCPCRYDPICDGVLDILDVTSAIDIAFGAVIEIKDPTCGVSRTDVNADGRTDVIDVVRLIIIGIRGGHAGNYLKDPCPG